MSSKAACARQDKVRITAQLIKASDGFQMWTDQFDRELKDIFAVQDEIAGLVAQQLQLKLGVTKPARVVDPEAYQLVLKGRHFWTQRGDANLAIAEEAFQRALAIDPNFAEAHAGIADVWMIRAWFRAMADGGPAVAEDLERATTAAQRATELDPGLTEPYATLGAVRHIQGRFAEVEALFARALELNPNYVAALHWHATHAMAMGRFDTSLEELRLATRLDPLAPMPLWALAGNLDYIGAAAEAFDVADRALRLRPGFPPLLAIKALAGWGSGRRDEALAAARTIAADHSDAPRWWADANAIFILRQSGHLDEAQQLADRVFATVPAVDYRRTLRWPPWDAWTMRSTRSCFPQHGAPATHRLAHLGPRAGRPAVSCPGGGAGHLPRNTVRAARRSSGCAVKTTRADERRQQSRLPKLRVQKKPSGRRAAAAQRGGKARGVAG